MLFNTWSGQVTEFSLETGITDYDFSLEEFAATLSRVTRYNGHISDDWNDHIYSVAHHSLIMSYIVPEEVALEALMHDAAEFLLNDLISPFKEKPEIQGFKTYESALERRIADWLGLALVDGKWPDPINQIDKYDMIWLEAKYVTRCKRDEYLIPRITPRPFLPGTLKTVIKPVGIQEIRETFLRRARFLTHRRLINALSVSS